MRHENYNLWIIENKIDKSLIKTKLTTFIALDTESKHGSRFTTHKSSSLSLARNSSLNYNTC